MGRARMGSMTVEASLLAIAGFLKNKSIERGAFMLYILGRMFRKCIIYEQDLVVEGIYRSCMVSCICMVYQ